MIELRDYQRKGVEYLIKEGGGFLWDEPGLGKTRQGIVAAKKLGGPALVVCPASLRRWWRQAINDLYPKDKILVAGVGGRFAGPSLSELATNGAGQFPWWTVVHYTGLRMNLEEYQSINWNVVICDEVHYIKNRKAQRTEAIYKVAPLHCHRIGLTATPWSTNPADLWSQLRWMDPTNPSLRSYWKFFNQFVEYEVRKSRSGKTFRDVRGGKNLEDLTRVMSRYGIRRSKKTVAPELPPIIDTRMPVEIEGRQKTTYHKLKKKDAVEFEFPPGDDDQSFRLVIPNALARMTRLEQFLSHPWTFVSGLKGAKLQWLLEWSEGNNQEQAVIATRFKASAERIALELNADGAITGDMHENERERVLRRWKMGKRQYLVGTIGTIGTGFNLQEAYTLVLYDQVYSPIEMEQVRHRTHRINTDHPVQVVYLHCEGTTNDIVLGNFVHKWQQQQMVRKFLEHLQAEER